MKKPFTNRYVSAQHEVDSKFGDFRKRLALRVEIQDFQAVSNDDLSKYAPSVIFRGPNFFNLRVRGVTNKLSNNTGIHPQNLRILEINISSKNYNIAWIKFDSEETVINIFKQSSIVQSNNLHMFPVIPELGKN